MPVSVRRAGPDDAAALAKLRWQWRVVERGESGMDEGEFTEALDAWYHEHAESHTAWLADVDGRPTGMAWMALVHRIPGPGIWVRLAGNLQSVYVRPAYRGLGLGRLLIEAVIDDARDRGLDYISVHPSERSFPVYRRAGFRESDGVLELDLRRSGA